MSGDVRWIKAMTIDNIFHQLWTARISGEKYNKAKEKKLWMTLQRFLESKGSYKTDAGDYS